MKKLSIILASLLTGCMLTACGPTTPGNTTPPDDPKAEFEYKSVVKGNDSLDLAEIVNKLCEEKMIRIAAESTPEEDGEIVFGDSERTVTVEAKAELEKIMSEVSTKNDDVIGYVIYKNQKGNVAVYWSDDYLEEKALSTFLENYCSISLLGALVPGVIISDAFSLDDYLYETAWAKVEARASKDVVDALKILNKYLDGSAIIDWMANLWEPYICVCGNCAAEGKEIACYGGAFYYANSARDYEGFLPDVESTMQALGRLQNSGAFEKYGNSYAKALPDEIKQKIVVFCQQLQDKDSGYFYHPQWGSNIGAARRGRDLGHATGLLDAFGAKPKYPTALENLGGTEDVAAKLTKPLGNSAASAVSKVAAVAAFEDSLGTKEQYLDWLYSVTRGIKETTEGAHTLASVRPQIKAAGYLDITMDYLDAKLRENYDEMKAAYDADPENNPKPTGLWQKKVDYYAVWGLLKLYGFYNATGRPLPYPVEAMHTCVEAIMIDADEGGNYHMNDVYNMWGAPNNILANAKKHHKELLPELYAIAQENAAAMIRETIAKLDKFKQEDGTYGYNQGTSSPTTQGVPVSLGLPEGDVNAVALAMDTYQRVFSVLGLADVEVKICDWRDGERFINTIMELGTAEKQPLATGEPYDFDTLPIGMSTGLKSGTAELVTDPADSSNSVLSFTTLPGSGESVIFTPFGEDAGAKKFVFEADVRLEAANYDYLFQMTFDTSYMIDFRYEGGKFTISDNATATSKNGYRGKWKYEANLKEWVKLRVEYNVDAENPTINIYINGTLFATSNNYYDSQLENPKPSNSFNMLKIWAMKNSDATILFDNVYVACER